MRKSGRALVDVAPGKSRQEDRQSEHDADWALANAVPGLDEIDHQASFFVGAGRNRQPTVS
jgi:hypothetical protein